MTATVADTPHPTVVYPVHAWLGVAETMGVTWEVLFAWFDALADDGPMFAGEQLQATGSITALRAVEKARGNKN